MHVESGMFGQPGFHLGVLVRRVVARRHGNAALRLGVVRIYQDVGRQSPADTTHQRGVLPGGTRMPPYGYVWKAKGDEILRKIQRAREALARLKSAVPSV